MNTFRERIKTEAKAALAACAQIEEKDLLGSVDLIVGARRVFFAGAGRSGLMVQAFAMRLAQMGVIAHVVGDVTTPKIERDDLLIVCSVSGKTPGPVLWAELASKTGAPVIAVTSNENAALARFSSHLMRLPLADKNNSALGTTMELVLHLLWDGLCWSVMDRLGITEKDLLNNHANLE